MISVNEDIVNVYTLELTASLALSMDRSVNPRAGLLQEGFASSQQDESFSVMTWCQLMEVQWSTASCWVILGNKAATRGIEMLFPHCPPETL